MNGQVLHLLHHDVAEEQAKDRDNEPHRQQIVTSLAEKCHALEIRQYEVGLAVMLCCVSE